MAGMISFLMTVLGKGTIMALSAFCTFLICKYGYPDVQQPLIPTLPIALFAYMVADLFLSIFGFSATAILHCFILDEEHGGSGNTPKGLQKLIDELEEKKGDSKSAKEAGPAGEME